MQTALNLAAETAQESLSGQELSKQSFTNRRSTNRIDYDTSSVTGRHQALPSVASGWCRMHSKFLQIRLIFSSPEGYRLQSSIPRAYFVYLAWHCSGLHCSFMYACMYHVFAGMWRPLVSVITTMYYVAKSILHRRVWHRVLSLMEKNRYNQSLTHSLT